MISILMTIVAEFLFWILLFKFWDRNKETVAYYTVDGHNLCPYPNMTDEDLDDYESYFRARNKYQE